MHIEKRTGVRAAIAAPIVCCLTMTSAVAAPLARLATAAPMAISVDFEFLWQPEPANATQVYLHVSNIAFEPSRSQVKKVYPKLRNPEWDFPVLLYMAHESGRDLQAVWKMRADGMSWTIIMGELGIPRERLVIEPGKKKGGPPHGVAHGYWSRHANETLTDDDVYYWVNIHALSRYFDYSPAMAATQREEGWTFKAIASNAFKNGQGKAKQYMKKSDVERAGMEPASAPPRARRGRPTKEPKKHE